MSPCEYGPKAVSVNIWKQAKLVIAVNKTLEAGKEQDKLLL